MNGTDGKGNRLRLDHFNDDHFGFVCVTVFADKISLDFFEIDEASGDTAADDHFELELNNYTDSTLT